MTARCLVADDHPALVAAVSEYLEGSGFEVVGPVGDGSSALALASRERPELALVDYRMPPPAGAQLLRELGAASPSTHLVVYTAEADMGLAREILAAGASGLVLKEAPLAELGRALAIVRGGRTYVDSGVCGRLGVPTGGSSPTARELEVLALLADGCANDEIGRRLGISGETARSHARRGARRLGARTRTHAVATALRQSLID